MKLFKYLILISLLPLCSLYAADVEDGFTSIFNGKDLTGWQYDKRGKDGAYVVEDGAIAVKSGANLYTKEEYDDYILRYDYKVDSGANNGMGLRSWLNCGDVAYSYFELQVLDNTAPKYAKLKDWPYHGSAYGIVPAKRGAAKPVGQWNQQEIYFKSNHLKVTVNGTVILDADLSMHKPLKN